MTAVEMHENETAARDCVNGRNGPICPGMAVRYALNHAQGTVVSVDLRRNTADVSWNVRGSGFGRNLSPDILIPFGVQPQPGAIHVGSAVRYLPNGAIGTVTRVDYEDGVADVDWNIRGSGSGENISLNLLTPY